MPDAMRRIEMNEDPPPRFFDVPAALITGGAGRGSIGAVPPPGRTPICCGESASAGSVDPNGEPPIAVPLARIGMSNGASPGLVPEAPFIGGANGGASSVGASPGDP
jgi:hypothetical protein